MSTLIEKAAGAVDVRLSGAADRSIGKILLDAGMISAEGAEKALRLHKEQGIRFGEACVNLGLVSHADIQQALSNQFQYPYLRLGQGQLSPSLVAAYEPFGKQVESLRALRTQLLLRWFNLDHKVLPVISVNRGDGRSFIAANLAVVFSQLGERTLLIDADLRVPTQHKLFNLRNQAGLSATLGGRGGEGVVERVEHFANLSVVAAGATPPNPLELLSRVEFRQFIASMADRFDVILIDTPAATSGADSQAIAAAAGGALALVREGRTRVVESQALIRSIGDANAEVVGLVMNTR